ncbi:hypothetical protein [Gemmiger formicilis]|uniref:hypothetical protein n=1 Tax=Gemmiger formicilis TaxID=745368 RepID=UPI00351FB45D
MKPLNTPNRQLKLSLVWLLASIAMIPVQGFCISTIWNWFMPIISLPTLTWLQAYCLLFAIKALLGSKSETETTKTIKSIIDGTCTKYDDYDIPDEVIIILLTILETVIVSALYLIIGWFLSCFLYL